ncbi:hypothetical protein [Paenibacillus harenae]|uniref:hypothetical protein n=1 Tax=Paenibacillus harenae TaxID=306543 RepID=UPI000491393B|nr:hypothetical protein [Paenibacillus harenae]
MDIVTLDATGLLIQLHDVLINEETGEMVIVVQGANKRGVRGLGVVNDVTGVKDWLGVYPDGVWTIVGNLATTTYRTKT